MYNKINSLSLLLHSLINLLFLFFVCRLFKKERLDWIGLDKCDYSIYLEKIIHPSRRLNKIRRR